MGTATTDRPIAAGAAAAAVTAFFESYRAHDVDAMARCCGPEARVHYPPVEMWGRQRALRGDGFVEPIGRVLWTGIVTAFPDLSLSIDHLDADEAGNVLAEVTFAGTQAMHWGVIANQGKAFRLPNLFLFRVDPDGSISRITAYWDGAELARQLGHLEVD